MNASVVDDGDSLATVSMGDGGVAESTAFPGTGDVGSGGDGAGEQPVVEEPVVEEDKEPGVEEEEEEDDTCEA